MKIKISILVGLVIGLLLGMLLTGVFVTISGENLLLQEIESPYDYQKTIDVMTRRIDTLEGWHVIKVFDYNHEVTSGGGEPIGKYAIIEFCNAKTASKMLVADNRKKIGAMLPKRFAVYEKNDGKVFIGAGNGPVMVQLFNGKTREIAVETSLEVESLLLFKTNQL